MVYATTANLFWERLSTCLGTDVCCLNHLFGLKSGVSELNEQITAFLDEFSNASFPHSDLLIAGLRAGTIELHSASETVQPTSHYLTIYNMRLANLLRRYSSQHTEHTSALCGDMDKLCDQLRNNPEEGCELWSFTEAPYLSYLVFIGHQSRHVLGCLCVADNRLLTPEIRKELWGESDSRLKPK